MEGLLIIIIIKMAAVLPMLLFIGIIRAFLYSPGSDASKRMKQHAQNEIGDYFVIHQTGADKFLHKHSYHDEEVYF